MSKLSIVIYAQDEQAAEAFTDAVGSTTHGEVGAVVRHEVDLKEALAAQRPAALLVDLGTDPYGTLDVLEQTGVHDLPVLVAGPQDDNKLLLRALKLGVKEFFPGVPSSSDLKAAIESLRIERLHADSRPGAPIIAVMGAKGGVGATFVACQLAASLHRIDGSAAIVDLNCPLGDVALQLDIQPRHTLASVLSQKEGFDATFLQNVLQMHSSGLEVLAAPERVEENELVRGGHVEKVLRLLQGEVGWIVVDVSRSWSEASVRALDLASEILLVASPDLAALAHTRQHVDLLKRLGHPDEKIHLVANRHSGSDAVTEGDFKKLLGRPFDVALPNDYGRAVEAVNGGKTLAQLSRGAPLTQAIERLAREAHAWCGVPLPPATSSGTGFSGRLRRLFGR